MTNNSRIIHHHVDTERTLIEAVARCLGGDHDRAVRLVDLGAVYRNKVRLFEGSTCVSTGDYLRLHTEPRRYSRPTDLVERLLYEDENWLVIDKTGGVPCHATVDNGIENLVSWWSLERGQPCFITHRLDVPTSGCLVLAKSPEGSSRFNKMLLKSGIEKEYVATVEGDLDRTGLVTHWMVDENWAPRHVRDEPFEGALECRLEIRNRETIAHGTRLDLRLLTGRTHQIRVQMSALGHPVLNDVMYGARRRWDDERIALRARRLAFRDPFTGKHFEFVAPKRDENDDLIEPSTTVS